MLPFKNEAQHLQSCLDSIAQQHYPNFTVAMVDDHSTDTSRKIALAKANNDTRCKYFSNKGHGVIAALQTAASQLNTEFITRMDGDDIMPPHKLGTLVRAVKPNTLVYGTVRYFGSVTKGYLKYEHWLNSTLHAQQWNQEIFRECVVPACAWMMRTKDFLRNTQWNDLQLPEDYHMLLHWFTAGMRFEGIPNLVHWWRHHQNRTSLQHKGYTIKAFTALKWHVLQNHFIKPSTHVILWGRGPKLKILQECVMRSTHPYTVISDVRSAAQQLENQLSTTPNTKVLSVVGSSDGMQASKALFQKFGLYENQSFFFL